MRWSGLLGYAQVTEVKSGVWEDVITEVEALGELIQRTEALDSGDTVLPQYRTTTSVSVLTGEDRVPGATIRFITLRGKAWLIASVVRQHPRDVIYIGEEYHGPRAE